VHRHKGIIRAPRWFLKPLRLPDGNVSYLFSFACAVAAQLIEKQRRHPEERLFFMIFLDLAVKSA